MEPKKNHKNAIVAGAIVVSLLIGGGVGYVIASGGVGQNNSGATSNAVTSSSSGASDGVTVSGVKLVRTKDIIDNASAAKNASTFVDALKTAKVTDTLKAEGPFTVFLPSNDTFSTLPEGTLDSLLKPENVEQLKNVLLYHVVPGTYTSADLRVMAQKGESFTTVQGAILTPVAEDGVVKIKDAKGGVVGVSVADVISSNGVVHIIDAVLMQ